MAQAVADFVEPTPLAVLVVAVVTVLVELFVAVAVVKAGMLIWVALLAGLSDSEAAELEIVVAVFAAVVPVVVAVVDLAAFEAVLPIEQPKKEEMKAQCFYKYIP